MHQLTGRVIHWSAPDNKGDAGRYWGHSGEYTLAVGEDVSLELRNAVQGVILRTTDGVSLELLAEHLGAEVEVEGEFSHGVEVEEEDTGQVPTGQVLVSAGPISRRVPEGPVMQTLMVPEGLKEDGGVRYRRAPEVEGAGFLVRLIRRC